MRPGVLSLVALLLWSGPLFAQEPETEPPAAEPAAAEPAPEPPAAEPAPEPPADEAEPKSAAHRILFYVPNRALDLLDVFRVRARLGPGVAVGLRATRPATVFIGAYNSAYIGLPGPRREPTLPYLLGPEDFGGTQFLAMENLWNADNPPGYGPTEVGASLQLGALGADLGVSLLEAVDFAAGFLFLDPVGDDL